MIRDNDYIDDIGEVPSFDTVEEVVQHCIHVANSLTNFGAVGTIEMTVLVDVWHVGSNKLRSSIGHSDNAGVLVTG